MTCSPVTLPGGARAIVCGPTTRCRCGKRSTLLCDWKVPSRSSGTCDASLCSSCTTSPAADKDLCPKHAAALEEWRKSKADRPGGLPDRESQHA